MVAGRTGSSMTTELGTMRVTEQIDAMAVMAVNPVQYLVMPRVLATTLMMPILVMLFNFVAIGGSYVLSVAIMNIDPGIFVQKIRDFVVVKDVFYSGIKAACFGVAIGLVGCYKGFYASGGAKGVGEATTSSVVTSSIAVLFIDYVLTVFMYSTN
jgi:phospholipid/cholesterol/gamma-HCH transport system permease protein